MFGRDKKIRSRPPAGRADARRDSAMQYALSALLESDSPDGQKPGRQRMRQSWADFVANRSPPPVSESRTAPELVGQELAVFIRNNYRIEVAQEQGKDHEIRMALGESVRSLSQLVIESSELRKEANDTLNRIEDLVASDQSSALEMVAAEVLRVRTLVRQLDERTKERRRAVNARLATLRMELLDLPRNSVDLHATVQSPALLEGILSKYKHAAKQLGESLSVLFVCVADSDSLDPVIQTATYVRDCFKRDIDAVVIVDSTTVAVFLIDTPDQAVESLIDILAQRMLQDPAFNSAIQYGCVAVDPDQPVTQLPKATDVPMKPARRA